MKAPPDTTQPITAERLHLIVWGFGGNYNIPPDNELAVLAAVLTGWQPRDPEQAWAPHLRRVIELPGHSAEDWHPLALEIAIRFQGMMEEANPYRREGKGFGYQGGIVESFVAAVIPLVLPGQRPLPETVGRFLARHLGQ
jgi:hypothetical protein